jgi:hypothetical protein
MRPSPGHPENLRLKCFRCVAQQPRYFDVSAPLGRRCKDGTAP